MIDVLDLRRNLERVEGLVLHGKETLRADSGAGSVLCPLMFEEG